MLFLYRPRQTRMPFRAPRPGTQQDQYNWQLQQEYEATQQVPPYRPDDLSPPSHDPISQLQGLAELRDSGVLTDAEFAVAKAKVIGDGGSGT